MTTAQYAQAIDEAYQKYVALFYNNNAPLSEQNAQFEYYLQLCEAYQQSKAY